ncbi:type II toxin-antitoxin system VapC family toxin [bacterium]|nr:type II toxin-antitoxin system VapC family toxin [bacterium]
MSEVGKIQLEVSGFIERLSQDPRLQLLILEAVHLNWTRDPFDRLLSAHSVARRLPLCSVDAVIRKHHRLLPPELH